MGYAGRSQVTGDTPLKGIVPSFSDYLNLLHHRHPAMMFCSDRASNRAKQPWTTTTETVCFPLFNLAFIRKVFSDGKLANTAGYLMKGCSASSVQRKL